MWRTSTSSNGSGEPDHRGGVTSLSEEGPDDGEGGDGDRCRHEDDVARTLDPLAEGVVAHDGYGSGRTGGCDDGGVDGIRAGRAF